MKKLFLFFLLLICGNVLADVGRQAYQLVKQGKTDQAIDLLNQEEHKEKANALFMLGMIYDSGKGVEKDISKAFDYYLRSADKGNEIAQLYVGLFYKEGMGVEKNISQAFKYFLRSAENGNREAQFYTGVAYKDGSGADKDTEKAIFWLRKASEQKNTRAMGMLAVLLFSSKSRMVEAYAWAEIAAKYDVIQAQTTARKVIWSYLSDTEKKEGKSLVKKLDSRW